MRQHAFDGEMGLAGVGRTEHGGHADAAGARITVLGGGEGNGHHDPLGIPARYLPMLCRKSFAESKMTFLRTVISLYFIAGA